jgi:hypothetical protein
VVDYVILVHKLMDFIDDMDLTMLRQISRRGRLMAMISSPEDDALHQEAAEILGDERLQDPLSTASTGQHPVHQTRIPSDVYNRIGDYLLSTGTRIQHANSVLIRSVAEAGEVLSPYGTLLHSIDGGFGRTFSTHSSHPGNGSIFYASPHSLDSGFIQSIWQIKISGIQRVFFDIRAHQALSNIDAMCSPYADRPRLNASIVYADETGSHSVIERSRIVAHGVYRARPRGTFGIDSPILILVNTDRGRFDYSAVHV